MPRVLLLIAMLIGTVLLTQCGLLPLPIPSAPPFPTVGPVQRISGNASRTMAVIQSSTNCAEIGEMVTFTASFTNTATYPVTITTEPVMDIVLSPSNWTAGDDPALVQHWSESDQYPTEFPTVAQPNEVWTYQWRWQADAIYHQPDVYDMRVQLIMGEIQLQGSSVPSGGHELGIGVGAIPLPGGGAVECYELERALQP
ncbi:MAG: hypothetical protein GFH27_549325n5 [Chloroflexi bacterium AL-W]|nr:hypothetical protein [Chloroflexi bacterium AL-N1]NOK70145.1 hypothetical protein [Chloroflexi bacterium AL-N10]NOK77843.1 hypothetical protein [Chloroflexi bacterium AL-N5]NOK84852.1 hypothetical protein [Chloroflexi bacterium AL-W]NOK63289.1 hypothetical protein [Chloroflexi bacterium AL-N1]